MAKQTTKRPTARQQADALHEALVQRWERLLESEMDAEEFWRIVRGAFGRDEAEQLSTSELRAAHERIRTARAWLRRLPRPELLA